MHESRPDLDISATTSPKPSPKSSPKPTHNSSQQALSFAAFIIKKDQPKNTPNALIKSSPALKRVYTLPNSSKLSFITTTSARRLSEDKGDRGGSTPRVAGGSSVDTDGILGSNDSGSSSAGAIGKSPLIRKLTKRDVTSKLVCTQSDKHLGE